MTPKSILMSSLIALTSNLAIAQEVNSNDPMHERPPAYRTWQCSAHGHHGNLYYGQESTSRIEAKQLALHECQHSEGYGYGCRIHECYLTSGY